MSEFQFNPEERNFTILQMVRSTQIIGDLNPYCNQSILDKIYDSMVLIGITDI